MRALILRHDPNAAVASSRALIEKGFQILCVDTRAAAEMLVRSDTIDLLVMDEQVQGEMTHTVALSGERQNPYISAILMTDRSREETDDLYDLIPSLYALVGVETAPSLVGQLAMASVVKTADMLARVAENTAADIAEEALPDEPPMMLDDAPMVLDEPIVELDDAPAIAADAWDALEEELADEELIAAELVEEHALPATPEGRVRIPSLAARMRVGATLAAYEADSQARSPFARSTTASSQFAKPQRIPPQPAA
ncbi:imidazoleglycerol-phosphate dehydratase [Cognatiyoonia sp. IB215182]|uniref:imidazoleglycerol-phosphate dehydratase n=1 Tax=Cognatiyoonia sp. IB215182 TaxID=3097353 RepID=UPI002A1007E4|nr:imidazoleglycerol-phosphate dehydratase [Cognatiyoonia sp. IB215182]MDX8351281.1 imidazoleglycerol-phosphate dehydratase [Cognatiyoonia sp. IB215182]